MANEATIFDSFSRYNDALLGIQEARFRREDEAEQRRNLELIANRVRQENRVEAKAEREANQIGRENEIKMMALNQEAARIANVKAQQDQLAERRANATKNAKVLQNAISAADGELAALVNIPLAVRNANARLVAETRTKDKAILDKFFNPKSATDNSLNFARIPGAEQEALFLSQQLAQLNDAAIAHLKPQIQSVTAKRDINLRLLDEIIRDATLSDEDFTTGARARVAPAVLVSDPAAAAGQFLDGAGGAKTQPAAPTNPGVGVVPGILNMVREGAGTLGGGLGYVAQRVGSELFGTQRPDPASLNLAAQSVARFGGMPSPLRYEQPSAQASQVFNAPAAPQAVLQDPAAFQADGLQKLQQILEQTYGPDSFIPEEAFPAIVSMARASGWSEEKIQNATNEIQSGNITGGGYQSALAFYRQIKAMSQGIPAPIQPGQSPGMQFGPAQIQFGPPEIQFGPR